MKTKKLTIIAASYLISSLLLSSSLFFYQPLASQGASGYDVYIVKAITDNKILPTDAASSITSIGTDINITAAPGEYEPASFVVRALQSQGVTGMQANATALTSGSNTIPASAVDIRYVKAWYQAGDDIYISNASQKTLTPELLLKDPNLVKVDLSAKTNSLKNPDGSYTNISNPTANLDSIKPQDAATLQPVDISANQNQQYWITVLVPSSTPAGTYQGNINLTASNAASTSVPIKVTVLPFALEKSALQYSIYYTGFISSGDYAVLGPSYKTRQQYLNDLKDMKAHGIDYPTSYQIYEDQFKEEIELRKQAGLPADGPFYSVGVTNDPGRWDPLTDPGELASEVKNWINILKPYGYNDFYFYGIDETDAATTLLEQPAWREIHQAGGKVFVADDQNVFSSTGGLLDLAVEKGDLTTQKAALWHGAGHKIFSYSNPQCGEEKPETYRRNYGLLLWKNNYDGAMDFAYQYGQGSMWNDFDNTDFRDEDFAYPTVNGAIDTIEWEGFREGVDDTRYLATLQKAIANSTNTSLKTEAQNWLNSLNVSNDLYTTRAIMIDYTTRLTNSTPTYKAEDVNSDGQVNTQDIQAATNQILGTQSWQRADVNADGKYDVKDLQRIANVILGV